jgi:hypothetical protein
MERTSGIKGEMDWRKSQQKGSEHLSTLFQKARKATPRICCKIE